MSMLSILAAITVFAQHPCQPCHAEIVSSYAKTAMARTSGRVKPGDHAPAGSFTDPVTQTSFSLTPALLLQFSKGSDVVGSRQLDYFLGSGRVGFSYLFQSENRLFQAPVSFYSATRQWQLSPGFDRRSSLDLTRVVEPSCLNCHTSNFDAAKLSFDNGITCERCHGEARQHMATFGKAAIVNPKKLPAMERESICAQCHLTGQARVAKFRSDKAAYTPGKKLSDYSAVFTGTASQTGAIGVTSHFEKLALSQCKLPTGEALSCTTCHNPHAEPANSSAFFNPKCQACHIQKPCKQSVQTDCIQCHMPKASGRGVDHSSYTDHSIPRARGQIKTVEFASFWPNQSSSRDLALAYSILGEFDKSQALLEAAAKANPADIAVLSQLAQIYDRQGKEEPARSLYESILKLEPKHPTAAANLAVIRIKAGRSGEAISLWQISLHTNPAQTGIRMNLAQALLRQGNREAAIVQVEKALFYDPDQPAARRLLSQLRQQ